MKPSSIALAAAVLCASGVAHAQDVESPFMSELRVGVLAHDRAPIVDNSESGTDLNVELLFRSPRGFAVLGAPRPHVGVTLASEGTSYAYAGLVWEGDFASRWFWTGAFGIAAHDGDPLSKDEQDAVEFETEKALGCRMNFHVGAGVGYRLTRRWNLGIQYEHLSNANLCQDNEGLENIGLRVGYMF
jgi:lipid A 3-O-deacylase